MVGFLGVGLDNADGHTRLTRTEHFILLGGSDQTHQRMQETAAKFAEGLKRRGKPLQEAKITEVIELMREASQ